MDAIHQQVYSLDRSGFMVQRELEYFDKYQSRESWNYLSDVQIREIGDHLAPLIIDVDETDELAKRFDMISLNAQMNLFTHNVLFSGNVETIQDISSKLLRKGAVPMVAEKLPFLKQLVTEAYWTQIDIFETGNHQDKS